MSYFNSDDEKEDYDSDSIMSNGKNDSDDDEPLNPPKKNINKQFGGEIEDELGDEDINDSDGNETDDIGMTDTDGEGDSVFQDEDEEEIKEEIKEGKEEKESKEAKEKSKKDSKKKSSKKIVDYVIDDINEDDDDDDVYDNENYLQKFDEGISKNYVLNNHPECVVHNYNEVLSMCQIIKDADGIIIDDLHKTIPYLTKYEKARILGVRAKQINSGATPFVKLSEGIIDGYIIAEMELKDKKIPFIIRRPMPNGGSEYWFLKDLEDLSY